MLQAVGDWLGYRRVSRVGERGETLISPEVQASRIEAYAAARSLGLRMLETELDVSGGKMERPVLNAAIAEVERGEAAGIIVAQIDRLSRMEIVDALQVIRKVESAGGQVIAVAENFDAATPEGRMGRNVFLAMAAMQLDRYKLQFRTAKARAVERGIWPLPVVPVGYVKGEDRRLHPGPERDNVIKAFEARAADQSWATCASFLPVGLSGAAKVVRNRVYLGEIHYGDWQNLEAHEPIISRDLWEAAQVYHPPPARSGNERGLLVGLIRCAGCGFRMSCDTVTGIYKCRPHKTGGRCPAPAIVSQRRVETLVRDTVLAHIASVTFTATERTDTVDLANEALERAEAELVLYQQAEDLADIGVEHFAQGMRQRVEAVESARRGLARARLAAPATPSAADLDDLTAKQMRALLRGAVGVVWVRKRRAGAGVRLIAAGFEPTEFGPLAWSDVDLPGEIRVLGDELGV